MQLDMQQVHGETPTRLTGLSALAYLAMLLAAVGLFLGIQLYGTTIYKSVSKAPELTVQSHSISNLFHILVVLSVVIIAARVVGRLFARLHQPAVIGEVVAGIMLGPSLLGTVAPNVYAFLLPQSIVPFLSSVSQLGVILYMFLVGIELNTKLLKRRTHAAVAVSHASIVVPFVLGSALALYLYPGFAPEGVPFTIFALFMGTSMSVTAFPVLARILTDRKMQHSRIGVLALTCAAVDDVTAWCLLAFVVSVATAEAGQAAITIALTLVYIAVMLLFARRWILRFVRKHKRSADVTQGTMAIVFVAVLLSALLTEAIGVHALFGAFVLGAMVPHNAGLARAVSGKLEHLVVVMFLPMFFAFTGMRTQIALVNSWHEWLVCGLVILCATAGKFGGSTIAARLTGLDWRLSSALGVLMNTRGMMELIVLNVGLDLGVLSPALFTMMVIMALVSTFIATPALQLLVPQAEQPNRA